MGAGPNFVKWQATTLFHVEHLATFAGRLKAARLAYWERFNQDMSRADLARLVGVSRSTVTDWEKGRYEPDQGQKEALAVALVVNRAWLILGEGDRYPPLPLEPVK